jgi:hypothetical protein
MVIISIRMLKSAEIANSASYNLRLRRGRNPHALCATALSPDGAQVCSIGYDNWLQLWKVANRGPQRWLWGAEAVV